MKTKLPLVLFVTLLLATAGCGDDKKQTNDTLDGTDTTTDATDVPSDGLDVPSDGLDGTDTADTTGDMPDMCVPDCAGAVCGDDGCGGTCGMCNAGEVCATGLCVVTDCPTGCTMGCDQGCFDLGDCTDTGGTLDIHPNIETAGVLATLPGTPGTVELYYRRSGEGTWFKGHDATQIPDGRWGSSLFWLAPETTYQIMLLADGAQSCASTTTQAEQLVHTTTQTLIVDAAAAPGGDGSLATPFQTIQAAVDAAAPGTDIEVRAGIYPEAVDVTTSGAPGGFVRIMGAPGAILDGSDQGAANNGLPWTADGAQVWWTPWTGAPTYLNRDGQRMYHYLSLSDLRASLGDDGEPIAEGWVVDGGRLYVRSTGAPDGYTWQVPSLEAGIALDGVQHIWIQGLEIRYYGEGEYPKGIDIRGADNVVVLDNHIYGTPSPVWIRRGSNDVRVQGNTIHQSMIPSWPWAAVKGTDHENSAISVAGGQGAIISDNTIHTIFNGIVSGSFSDDMNTDIAYDIDVYRNRMLDTMDDGLEPEGACVNNRFWANTVDSPHNGISLAPITYGPVWVLRNRFTDFRAGGFKVSNDSSGRVWLYHNTVFTDRPDTNGMSPSGPFTNMVFRNNVIRGTRYAFEDGAGTQPNDFDYDNFYTTRGAPVIKWDDVRYDTVEDWCAAVGQECNGQTGASALDNPNLGRFAPGSGSANIDAGQRIYGINDAFTGTGPDIGYAETGATEVPILTP